MKARAKLGCFLKQLMTELSIATGPSFVPYDTVRHWNNKFESGVEFMENVRKSGSPKFASRKPPPPPPFGYPHADLRFSLKLFQIAAEAYSNTQFRDLILPVCIHYVSCTHALHSQRARFC